MRKDLLNLYVLVTSYKLYSSDFVKMKLVSTVRLINVIKYIWLLKGPPECKKVWWVQSFVKDIIYIVPPPLPQNRVICQNMVRTSLHVLIRSGAAHSPNNHKCMFYNRL